MRVQERILAKFWRASRVEFNSRARSLYGIGADNRKVAQQFPNRNIYAVWIGPQPYPVIYVAANLVRGLLDRKRSEEHLKSSNESTKKT